MVTVPRLAKETQGKEVQCEKYKLFILGLLVILGAGGVVEGGGTSMIAFVADSNQDDRKCGKGILLCLFHFERLFSMYVCMYVLLEAL